MVQVGRSIEPLVGARQGRHALLGVEVKRVARAVGVERIVQILQLRGVEGPVVQHLLQAMGDARGVVGGTQVARDHDQLAVARSVFIGS